ncbi:MAG: hypothetical protein B7Z22_13620 [Hyphomonas sp. 32-62-5]|nr:MAG: hypothetical protein B7Z22_13620 [Hyphomonas sp. 32-62-5]
MVAGIDRFREFFKDYPDHYAIIGGAACDILFDAAGLPFRATKDIDMVLCIEVVDKAFGEMFRDFLNAGGYEAREQSSGHREFYRFHKPKDKNFPFMVELFSKEPDKIILPENTGVVRLEVDDDIVSLSAILLDPQYFEALQNGKRVENGVTILDQSILIPFKARAFLDLTGRRDEGDTTVKGDDIKKHRADVFRLSQLLPGNAVVQVSDPLREDVRSFLAAIEAEGTLDPRALNIPMTREEAISFLRKAYGNAEDQTDDAL